jgi:hypothetical protein
MKALEAQDEALRAIVMAEMGEADTLLLDGKPIVTWKLSKPAERLDTKALKSHEPEVWKKYLQAGQPSRRFLIK